MGVFSFFSSLDNYDIFKYILIFLLIFFLLRNVSIGLNIILIIFITLLAISFLYEKNVISDEIEEKRQHIKKQSVFPSPKEKYLNSNEDLNDFLFSIQDFYQYNPQAYEEMIDNINAFLRINELIVDKEVKYPNSYYLIAASKKENALNNLQSIIYKLPNDPDLTDKLDRSHKRLASILLEYINGMYYACQINRYKNGYNVGMLNIDLGPKARNNYNDEEFSFQFY